MDQITALIIVAIVIAHYWNELFSKKAREQSRVYKEKYKSSESFRELSKFGKALLDGREDLAKGHLTQCIKLKVAELLRT